MRGLSCAHLEAPDILNDLLSFLHAAHHEVELPLLAGCRLYGLPTRKVAAPSPRRQLAHPS
jgi:hypothetical protein